MDPVQAPFLSRPPEPESQTPFTFHKFDTKLFDIVGTRKGPAAAALVNQMVEGHVHESIENPTTPAPEHHHAKHPSSKSPKRTERVNNLHNASTTEGKVHKTRRQKRHRLQDRTTRASLTISDLEWMMAERRREEHVQAQQELADRKKALNLFAEEVKRLNEENDKLSRFKAGYASELTSAQEEKEQTSEQLKRLKDRFHTASLNLKGVFGDMDYLKSRNNGLNKTITELKDELGKLKGNGRRNQAAVSQLQAKLEKLRYARQSLLDRSTRVNELEDELTGQLALRQQIQQQLHEKSMELVEERNSKARLEQHLQDAIASSSQQTNKIAALDMKIDQCLTAKEQQSEQQSEPGQAFYDEIKTGFSGLARQLDDIATVVATRPQLKEHLSAENRPWSASAGNDECSDGLKTPDMLDLSSPSAFPMAAPENVSSARPNTSNNLANIKSKIARSTHNTPLAHAHVDPTCPFGSIGRRTPKIAQRLAAGKSRAAVAPSFDHSSTPHSPPRVSRVKQSVRAIQTGMDMSPLKPLQLGVAPRKRKSKNPSHAEMAEFFNSAHY